MRAPEAVAAMMRAFASLMPAWIVFQGVAWLPQPVVQLLDALT